MNRTVHDVTAAINYSFIFSFEQNFDYPSARRWFEEHWHHCIYYSFIYLVIIFSVQHVMRRRSPPELRTPLFVWSGSLALFSFMGAARVVPELVYCLRQYGFGYSVCDTSYLQLNLVSGFWSWAFTVSKLPELIDTLFIVLRKQPLIFLHWYHHVTTLAYVWYSYAGPISTGRWFVALSYSVHAVMYSYHALKALRLKIPRQISMVVTLGQLSQMLMGIYINVSAYQRKIRGETCDVSLENIRISLSIYFSFFILFAHFFRNAYVKKKPRGMGTGSVKTKMASTQAPDVY